jgi:hypothetical protein
LPARIGAGPHVFMGADSGIFAGDKVRKENWADPTAAVWQVIACDAGNNDQDPGHGVFPER